MESYIPEHSPLGKASSYISEYNRDLLFPIGRKAKRDELSIPSVLPFSGCDIWNAYELSWLNAKGKPIVAIGEFVFPCESPNLIESKSFKLYLNSFNNTHFTFIDKVKELMEADLSAYVGAPVRVKITLLHEYIEQTVTKFSGICLDSLDITCDTYQTNAAYLETEDTLTNEVLYSDLLKSNCLVTGQPDWGSIQIEYKGKQINHEGLLKYLISFRNHNEFHEQCVERIFMDIMQQCKPEKLTVYARYTRRGGLDINPVRSTERNPFVDNVRLERQ